MKPCLRCGEIKELTEFARDRKRKDGLQAYCNICHRKEARDTYRANPEPYKRRAATHRDRLRAYLMKVADEIRTEYGCAFCGERTTCILDFHHHETPGEPVARTTSKSLTAFRREVNRCVVVCANCHRKIHAGQLAADRSMLCKINDPRTRDDYNL
jgi:transcription elongation factor Elf1